MTVNLIIIHNYRCDKRRDTNNKKGKNDTVRIIIVGRNLSFIEFCFKGSFISARGKLFK